MQLEERTGVDSVVIRKLKELGMRRVCRRKRGGDEMNEIGEYEEDTRKEW